MAAVVNIGDMSLQKSAQYLDEVVKDLKDNGLYTPELAEKLSYVSGTIKTLLNPAPIPHAPENFEYMPNKRQLIINGKLILLSKLESLAFGYLHSKAKNFCTYEELAQAMHGESKTSSVQSVKQVVTRLRRRMGEEGSRRILTHGRAYMLDMP